MIVKILILWLQKHPLDIKCHSQRTTYMLLSCRILCQSKQYLLIFLNFTSTPLINRSECTPYRVSNFFLNFCVMAFTAICKALIWNLTKYINKKQIQCECLCFSKRRWNAVFSLFWRTLVSINIIIRLILCNVYNEILHYCGYMIQQTLPHSFSLF